MSDRCTPPDYVVGVNDFEGEGDRPGLPLQRLLKAWLEYAHVRYASSDEPLAIDTEVAAFVAHYELRESSTRTIRHYLMMLAFQAPTMWQFTDDDAGLIRIERPLDVAV